MHRISARRPRSGGALVAALALLLLGCPPDQDLPRPGSGVAPVGSDTAAAPGEEEIPAAGAPDLSHVAVGQKWVFATLPQGTRQTREVTAVGQATVTYRLTTTVGGLPLGEPAEETWRSPGRPLQLDEPDTQREQVPAGARLLDCLVTSHGGERTWQAMGAGRVITFPGVVKRKSGDTVELELLEVTGP